MRAALTYFALACTLAACGGDSTSPPQGPSPLTNSIVFVSDRSGVDELYVMNSDGSNVRMIPTLAGQKSYPVPSPDGRHVLFTLGTLQTGSTSPLYIVGSDGTGLLRLTTEAAMDYLPSWSPDGTRIAFVSTRDGNDEIYVMHADGTSVTNISNAPSSDDSWPSWSPDGNTILFQSDRGGATAVYAMTSGGANPTLAASGFEPRWSPNGSKFLFKNNANIWVASWSAGTAGTPAEITTTAGFYFGPGWSPDGSRIFYVAPHPDNEEIWSISAVDGSDPVQLTPDSTQNAYAMWTQH